MKKLISLLGMMALLLTQSMQAQDLTGTVCCYRQGGTFCVVGCSAG